LKIGRWRKLERIISWYPWFDYLVLNVDLARHIGHGALPLRNHFGGVTMLPHCGVGPVKRSLAKMICKATSLLGQTLYEKGARVLKLK
jgi:hypothetical protein